MINTKSKIRGRESCEESPCDTFVDNTITNNFDNNADVTTNFENSDTNSQSSSSPDIPPSRSRRIRKPRKIFTYDNKGNPYYT